VDNKEIVEKNAKLLEDELTILNHRLNHLISNIWKVRQIALTLWVAAIGVGLGAISKSNEPILNILALSILIPLLFLYIDARMMRWYGRFMMRDFEIQRFLNEEIYFLPSTQEKMSFVESLKREEWNFPVYDISGEKTFGPSKYYRWRSGFRHTLLAATNTFFYGLQMLASILFTSLEFKKIYNVKLWWIPFLLIFFLIFILYFLDRRTMRKLFNKHLEKPTLNTK